MVSPEWVGIGCTAVSFLVVGGTAWGRLNEQIESINAERKEVREDLEKTNEDQWKVISKLRDWQEAFTKEMAEREAKIVQQIHDTKSFADTRANNLELRLATFETKLETIIHGIEKISLDVQKIKDGK